MNRMNQIRIPIKYFTMCAAMSAGRRMHCVHAVCNGCAAVALLLLAQLQGLHWVFCTCAVPAGKARHALVALAWPAGAVLYPLLGSALGVVEQRIELL